MRYTFGDTMTAIERLKRIADFFNPLAAEFIAENLTGKTGSVIDLGCGPGYSTEMLANATGADPVYGIDISDNFLAFAKEQYPNFTFLKHDVRETPFPVKADAIYVRFLMSHLNHIRLLVENWLQALYPSGYLIIDELEDIYTERKVFRDYLDISNGLVQSQGADLFIGKVLSEELKGLHIVVNVSSLIPVNDHMAASWFYPNTISIWNTEEWIRNRISENDRMKISDELLRISGQISSGSSITWRMRRIILTRKN